MRLRVAGPVAGVAALLLTTMPTSSASGSITGGGPERHQDARAQLTYTAPVEAPVIDPFRPPANPFAAGNRGVDYSTASGTPVRASAPGVVTFAGPVGGTLHVVVLHPDGVRTSYSFLATVSVRRGYSVSGGEVIGTAGPKPLHFGARLGDEYIDPLGLLTLSPSRVRVRLLPDDGRGLPPEAEERSALGRLLRAVGGAAVPPWAIEWAGGKSIGLVSALGPEAADRVISAVGRLAATGDSGPLVAELRRSLPDPSLAEVVAAALRTMALGEPTLALSLNLTAWQLTNGPCTPQSEAGPWIDSRPGGGRRLAVLVGGLGSTSENAAIFELETESLGYREEDTVRFSYRGGSTDGRAFTRANRYQRTDTQVPIEESGARLAELLQELTILHPGVPIDVFAHSQGGLVARAALTSQPGEGAAAASRSQAQVEHLVTFGTPHDGADLAQLLQAAKRTPAGAVAAQVGGRTRPFGLDPTRPSLASLAPDSPFLSANPIPPGVKVTSIATRRDVVVPAPRSWLKGAKNVIVPSHGVNAHDRLPKSKEALREAALAVSDLPPTCESVLDAVMDTAAATAVQLLERTTVASLDPRRAFTVRPAPYR